MTPAKSLTVCEIEWTISRAGLLVLGSVEQSSDIVFTTTENDTLFGRPGTVITDGERLSCALAEMLDCRGTTSAGFDVLFWLQWQILSGAPTTSGNFNLETSPPRNERVAVAADGSTWSQRLAPFGALNLTTAGAPLSAGTTWRMIENNSQQGTSICRYPRVRFRVNAFATMGSVIMRLGIATRPTILPLP